ncbi:hypothetical protein LJC56_02105 [Christensenellaceae bacterium OttesenSCG-928-K19]|nr:hypothetical protein [Christensenellaceae bacterium OttesenSCG-928-K19]
MSELEKLNRAKQYMDALANGIDPISGQDLPEDTTLNQVRLARCFFYVSDVLRRVIENGGEVAAPRKKQTLKPFSITQEQASGIAEAETPLPISHFCELVSTAVCGEGMKKLGYAKLTSWLVDRGYLVEIVSGGKRKKRATEKGTALGILEEEREGQYGHYIHLLYSPAAQRFLLDHLHQILIEQDSGSSRA